MSSDRLTILAVDDEHTQLEDLARLLRSFSRVDEVECAFDGHDALLKASSSATTRSSSTSACPTSTASSWDACCGGSRRRRSSCS